MKVRRETLVLAGTWAASGTVYDADGQPLEGVRVILESRGDDGLLSGRHRLAVTTDATGSWMATGLLQGKPYSALFLREGFAHRIVPVIRDPQTAPLVVYLESQSLIEGVVVGAGGQPVTNAIVMLVFESVESDVLGGVLIDRTDAHGRYAFAGVGNGPVRIEAVNYLSRETGSLSFDIDDEVLRRTFVTIPR